MDMFGSSDEEDNSPGMDADAEHVTPQRVFSDAICNAVHVALVKLKPKAKSVAANDANIILEQEIAIITSKSDQPLASVVQESAVELISKFDASKVRKVTLFSLEDFLRKGTENQKFDTIVCLFHISDGAQLQHLSAKLMPKGRFMSFSKLDHFSVYTSNDWLRENEEYCTPYMPSGAGPEAADIRIIIVTKRAVHCNQAGALYWPGLRTEAHIVEERKLLENISVTLSAQEVSKGVFSTASHDSVVRIIQEHGVCVFPQIFAAQDVLAWGSAARADMKEAIEKLRARHHVDLLADAEDVHIDNVVKDNFHELSMREAYRCDLRNTPRMQGMHANLPKHLPASSAAASAPGAAKTTTAGAYASAEASKAALQSAPDAEVAPTTASKIVAAVDRAVASRAVPAAPVGTSAGKAGSAATAPELRYHRGLVGALTQIMNPTVASNSWDDVNVEHGNWGKWNFNGPGPGSFTPPCIGKMASVVSLPGCKDQTIHADTAHIFEHTHLPAHYLNFFMPCAPSDGRDVITAQALKPAPTGKMPPPPPPRRAEGGAAEDDEEVYVDEEATLRELVSSTTGTTASSAGECYYQGQTAFVVGSHRMDVAATAMTHADAQEYLQARLVRPQLSTGDALIFDCRILHFGLSNWSHLKRTPTTEQDWRMMMYVNYHQQWFLDPKNWNDNAKLF
jgi:hypothetical protein